MGRPPEATTPNLLVILSFTSRQQSNWYPISFCTAYLGSRYVIDEFNPTGHSCGGSSCLTNLNCIAFRKRLKQSALLTVLSIKAYGNTNLGTLFSISIFLCVRKRHPGTNMINWSRLTSSSLNDVKLFDIAPDRYGRRTVAFFLRKCNFYPSSAREDNYRLPNLCYALRSPHSGCDHPEY